MKYLFHDTCSIMDCTDESFCEDDVTIVISNVTWNELEHIKTSKNKDEDTKYRARRATRLLTKYSDKCITVVHKRTWNFLIYLKNLENNNDSKIMTDAYKFYEKMKKKDNEFFFVSKDHLCREIAATNYNLPVLAQTVEEEEEYTGYKEIYVSEQELASFYSEAVFNHINTYNLLVNQYLILRDIASKEVIDKYKWTEEGYQKVKFIKVESKMFGKVGAKDNDIYQSLALDALTSNQITMIEGPAGTGKSYLSFGYMFHLLEHGKIDKIIIFCNTVATKGSAKLGFYPGSRDEKLLDSQIGNLLSSKLGDRLAVEDLMTSGKLILLPMSDIRGYDTSGMRAAVYISEAQNLDIELMRLALQRIGEDSFCIIDGDSNTQVDMAEYAGANNGMKRVSKVFRGDSIFGTVQLKTIKRSHIAELAQQL